MLMPKRVKRRKQFRGQSVVQTAKLLYAYLLSK